MLSFSAKIGALNPTSTSTATPATPFQLTNRTKHSVEHALFVLKNDSLPDTNRCTPTIVSQTQGKLLTLYGNIDSSLSFPRSSISIRTSASEYLDFYMREIPSQYPPASFLSLYIPRWCPSGFRLFCNLLLPVHRRHLQINSTPVPQTNPSIRE